MPFGLFDAALIFDKATNKCQDQGHNHKKFQGFGFWGFALNLVAFYYSFRLLRVKSSFGCLNLLTPLNTPR